MSVDTEECFVCQGAAEEDAALVKPNVDRVETTSYQSSRNGTDIDHVVVHYTTSRDIEGTISWFKPDPNDPHKKQTSAHYIVGRDGTLVQMVPDAMNAWHAGQREMNQRSIGIEHVAAAGDRITPAQSMTSIALIRWLCATYEIKREDIIPHVCVKATDCCGDLFADYGGFRSAPCDVQRAAVRAWLEANGLTGA